QRGRDEISPVRSVTVVCSQHQHALACCQIVAYGKEKEKSSDGFILQAYTKTKRQSPLLLPLRAVPPGQRPAGSRHHRRGGGGQLPEGLAGLRESEAGKAG